VSYWALAGPLLLWLGGALLAWRAVDALYGRGHRLVAALVRPAARGLHHTAAAAISRRRRPLAGTAVLFALAIAFAASTAVFNATYRHQVGVDARLTNGADVTVTEPPGVTSRADEASRLARVPGVRHVEPIV